jgi:hypothetical protein
MKKIVIAYHAYLYGSKYLDMMKDQLRLLMTSGLYKSCSKLYIGMVDSPNKMPSDGADWAKRYLGAFPEIVLYPVNKEEATTLKWIRDYSVMNPDDYIMYFHMKGISKQNRNTEDWRRYMEYFVIENWTKCVQKLDEGYDCCGVMWNTDTPIGIHSHFSGNFWWAKTGYINTLDHTFLDAEFRWDREFWIGTNPNAKAFEFHNSRMNDKIPLEAHIGHYDRPYPRNKYAK